MKCLCGRVYSMVKYGWFHKRDDGRYNGQSVCPYCGHKYYHLGANLREEEEDSGAEKST